MRIPLKLHPESRCEAVIRIEVEVSRPSPRMLAFHYFVSGTIADVSIPPAAVPARRDGLWQQTCFEAFLRASPDCYYEFNLSPSAEWAAYRFSGYRSGMSPVELDPPRIETHLAAHCLELRTILELPADPPFRLGLSAVIEETNGRKSYWALAHPAGKPDFHHPESFTYELS